MAKQIQTRRYTKEQKAERRSQHDLSLFSNQLTRNADGTCIPPYGEYTATAGRKAPAWEVLNDPSQANKIFSVPDAKGNIVNISLEWLAGFIDGEGTLTFNLISNQELTLKFQVQPVFAIVQGQSDYLLLTAIANFLGYGTVNVNRSDKTSTRYHIRIVDPKVLVNLIIPLLNVVPLRTKKGQEFLIWRGLVEIVAVESHKQNWPDNYLSFIDGLKSLKYVGLPTDQALDFLSTCVELEQNVRNSPNAPK